MANVLSSFLKIVGGLVVILIAVLVAYYNLWGWNWTQAVIDLIQGSVIILVVLIGLLLVFLGFTSLKE